MRFGLSMVVLLVPGCAQQDDKALPQQSPPVSASASPSEATASEGDKEEPAPRVGGPGRGYGGPRPGLPTMMPSAVEESALTLPNLQSCQSSCVDRNRARSVGADQIDADCRAECKRSCLDHCKTASAATRAACTKDCERQAERVR